jgi:acyl-CoA hydrolase
MSEGKQISLREPIMPVYGAEPKYMQLEDAMQLVKSGNMVFIQGAASTPLTLVEGLTEHGKTNGLKNVGVCHIHTEGPAPYMDPDCQDIFRANCFFTGSNARQAVNEGRADSTPVFLSEVPLLFHRDRIKLDVALIQITPPDQHGFCCYGTSVDVTRAALQNAKIIIAQVNQKLPYTYGDSAIHISHIDAIVESTRDLPEHLPRKLDHMDKQIGKLIAEQLVEDGATLQMGIGAIPDAVLACLTNHKNLGVHSEMFSDGVVDLVEKGCITNHLKELMPGKIVTAFLAGSKRLFDFVDHNPFVCFKEVLYTNMSQLIAMNPRVTALNSCIEVDLTGQVCSDSIGAKVYSGFGGQVDFLRGAAISHDGRGKPILALRSTTNKGESKIVPLMKAGAGVVTTRAHVHYIVTEYGVASLWGKNLRQRAYHLIHIAHPDHREKLEKAAFARFKCMPSPD